MYIFGYYIDKKLLLMALGVIIVIIIAIVSVNIRINKNKISTQTYVGYKEDDPEAMEASGYDLIEGQVAIYDYYKLFDYFQNTEDALDFKDYLIDYVKTSGTTITEWWVTNIIYDSNNQTLMFSLRTNDNESFYISKNNEKTYISYTHK